MELTITENKEFLKQIPDRPGVYRFYAAKDKNEELLYVGKAINLSKRVKSYFQKTIKQSPRISLMIAQIARIEITITDNEASALILENNLIKSLKPKYNILFRDDKSYPLIRISTHKFARIDAYRGKTNQKMHQYFGPYPNAYAVTHAINLIQKLFKLRTCTDSIFANRSRPCILHQIKLCTAPCVGYVNQEQYQSQVNMAIEFLKGNYKQIVADLTKAMNEKAENMEFEAAAAIRDKITLLGNISTNQVINNHNQPITADIIIAKSYLGRVFIYLISLQNGIYSGDKHFVINDPDDDIKEVLEVFVQNYYLEHQQTQLVYLSFDNKQDVTLDNEFLQMFYSATKVKIIFTRPVMFKKIFQMAEINLERVIKNKNGHNELKTAADKLAKLLEIEAINRIECVDISHHHGANAVASCVVYQDGKIDNSLYRRYNLPASVGGDDLAGMKQMLERRFAATDLPVPQVILIDGGITQFKMLKNLIQNSRLCGKIRAVSIFKGEKRKAQYDQVIIHDHMIVQYKDDPELFKLLQGLRDEAHRFAITGHRKSQIKTMTVSALENIPNIGAGKRRILLTHFGGIKGVMQASVDELQQVPGIGLGLAQQIFTYFHNE
ncbi:MAG: uvrC [Burkholderiales bacterium]|jgi:excinuclease ABC subunit C|nr:uvrC [Burkholderiales bacterium]